MNTQEIDQKAANEIEVVGERIDCSNATRVCDPECLFDMIEECKTCGRWV